MPGQAHCAVATRTGRGRNPLLFIESMSAGETRKYVQKVMANIWVYRNKFGQEPVSLRILAAESWPLYVPQDQRARLVPANTGN